MIVCTTCWGRPPNQKIKCKKCDGTGIYKSKDEVCACWRCGGNKKINVRHCDSCNGKGQIVKPVVELIYINPGITNN